MITEIPELDMVKTIENSCPVSSIFDFGQPLVENVCRFYFISHVNIVAQKRQCVKCTIKDKPQYVNLRKLKMN